MRHLILLAALTSLPTSGPAIAQVAAPEIAMAFASKLMLGDRAGAVRMISGPVQQVQGRELVPGKIQISGREFMAALASCRFVSVIDREAQVGNITKAPKINMNWSCGSQALMFSIVSKATTVSIIEVDQYVPWSTPPAVIAPKAGAN